MTEVLPWCPEVLARLAALNAEGSYHRHVFVVRVKRRLALLCDGDLADGKGWEQFTTIDLWKSLALRTQLADIVRDQARQLPRIVFREENQ
ncbi:hypothetical protein AB5J52_49875 (plasmid) [Streptomyces sp. R39]|uniref:Uncharacterized protein n=1 Tax=Streptomyces sp. R39 TaxID=3238631 RepID=A0AB39R6M3_9ACTN